jgi:co-chaperonin GroES (HSP10)
VTVGPGPHDQRGRFVPTTLRPGDDVLYDPTAGAELRIDGKKMIMAHERDILVVLHDVPDGVVFIG